MNNISLIGTVRIRMGILMLLTAVAACDPVRTPEPPSTAGASTRPVILMITGNGNEAGYTGIYPSWIHEFQNETVKELLDADANVHITTDLNTLHPEQLDSIDLIINNSLFLEPNDAQLAALEAFVRGGKAYLALHCGILSFMNWPKYQEFMGGFFVGGPADDPATFKVYTANDEFWGYGFPFRKPEEHPVSRVTDDFETTDELYYFQPSTTEFHVIARAENHPVMWWHPFGQGRVMALTLGHDEAAKRNPGYGALLRSGVRWLTGIPLVHSSPLRPFSTRSLAYPKAIRLEGLTTASTDSVLQFGLVGNAGYGLFEARVDGDGHVSLALTGQTGSGQLEVFCRDGKGREGRKTLRIDVVEDGSGNVAPYFGNTATSSSSENEHLFQALNAFDGDLTTRWSSSRTEQATLDIDLQQVYALQEVRLHWEAAYARAYRIAGSVDGNAWQTLADIGEGDGGLDVLTFPPADVRYLRVECRQRAEGKWGYSLFEVELYPTTTSRPAAAGPGS